MNALSPDRIIVAMKGGILLVVLGTFLFFAARYFSVFGNLTIDYHFDSTTSAIDGFRPLGRAADREENLRTGETMQRIMGEPVYLDLDVPRAYDTIDVELEYVNPDQPLTEFGLVTFREPWGVELLPMENRVIDEALAQWETLTGKDPQGIPVTLAQREHFVNSVDEFFQKIPVDRAIGTYHIDPVLPYDDPTYTPTDASFTLPTTLRGTHQFAVYLKNEQLQFSFDRKDVNATEDPDTVTISIEKDGAVIFQEVIEDDGNISTNQQENHRFVEVTVPDAITGVVTIMLSTTRDVFFEHFTTSQEKLVVKNSISIVGDPTNPLPLTIFMDGRTLSVETTTSERMNTVMVAGHTIDQWWDAAMSDTKIDQLLPITLEHQTANLETNGYFAFSTDSYFDPDGHVEKISDTSTLGDYEAILFTNYVPPTLERTRNIKHQTLHFDLRETAMDRKHLTFVLSAPGLDRRHAMLTMRAITISFHRESLWRRMLQRFFSS